MHPSVKKVHDLLVEFHVSPWLSRMRENPV